MISNTNICFILFKSIQDDPSVERQVANLKYTISVYSYLFFYCIIKAERSQRLFCKRPRRCLKSPLNGKPKSLVLAVNRTHRLQLLGRVRAQRTVRRNQVHGRKTQSVSLTMSYIRRLYKRSMVIINNTVPILAFVLHTKRFAINIMRSDTRPLMNLSIILAHLLY